VNLTPLLTRARRIADDMLGHVEAHPVRALFFFTYAGTSIYFNFFLVTLRHEGFSGRQMACISGLVPIMGFVTQPIWGVLADRFGRRRCLQLATLLTALLFLRMYSAHGFWPVILTAGVLAIFYGTLAPLIDAVALDFVEAQGKLNYGMFRIWGAIAAGVGTAGAGFLIEGQSTRHACLWAAGMLIAGLLFGAFARRAAQTHALEKITFKGLGSIIRNRPLMMFLLMVFFVAFCSTSFWNFNGVYFTDIGGTPSTIGLALALDSIGEIPLYFLSAPIFRRFGLNNGLMFTFVCSTVRVFSYAFISNPHVAIWVELSNGVSWTLFWVGAVEYVNQVVKPEWRATGQSLLNAACFGAGTILGILWNGFFLDYAKEHFINPWVKLPIQKLCFASGLLWMVVTIASAIYFRTTGKASAGPAAQLPVSIEEAA